MIELDGHESQAFLGTRAYMRTCMHMLGIETALISVSHDAKGVWSSDVRTRNRVLKHGTEIYMQTVAWSTMTT
jgi:hypothetical protein